MGHVECIYYWEIVCPFCNKVYSTLFDIWRLNGTAPADLQKLWSTTDFSIMKVLYSGIEVLDFKKYFFFCTHKGTCYIPKRFLFKFYICCIFLRWRVWKRKKSNVRDHWKSPKIFIQNLVDSTNRVKILLPPTL